MSLSWKTPLLLALALLFVFSFAQDEGEAAPVVADPLFNVVDLEEGTKEGHHYEAEINRLMSIIIDSLYSNRDVFLRELVANSADALDKIRFQSLSDPSALEANSELKIEIRADAENNILYIRDTGIGMTKSDMINNLGSVAKSGTREFLQKASQADTQLIGQFGVGFYSAFLVADKVTVTSKNNDDEQYIWESVIDDSASYSVTKDPRGNTLGRGTLITLHLKEDATEYALAGKPQELIKRYNEFIQFPIYVWTAHEEEVPMPEVEEAPEAEVDEGDIASDEVDEDEEAAAAEPLPPIMMEVWDWEQVETAEPIWRRPKDEITEEQYNDFFKNVLRDYADPLAKTHFKTEGDIEFTSLLYIPSNPPGDMLRFEYNTNLKLYVKRVFITDDFEDLMPSYLNFLKGIIDSDDLPLNVNRETLQESKILQKIKKRVVRKTLKLFADLMRDEPETYSSFYDKYATNLKLGCVQDRANMARLSKLLMFYSSDDTEKRITFDEYVENMKEGQEDIYYLGGESIAQLKNSPLIQRIVAKGYTVLLLPEPIDEYALGALGQYDAKYKFVDVAKDGLNLDEDDEASQKELDETYKPLTEWIVSQLSERISKATVSMRLTTAPLAIVASASGYSANMERVIKAQALHDDRYYPKTPQKHVLEVNPRHPIVQRLLRLIEENEENSETSDIINVLYDVALLNSGYNLADPTLLSDRITRMSAIALSVDPDAEIEAEEFPEPPTPIVEEEEIGEEVVVEATVGGDADEL
eukprot:TRINITY_DN104_c0_g1_i1.p1 TRINITY_DN104_c0_g1~~TRINITY_DN104_c0_g1_i1.p1  ORF type:complete len:757 (+),score=277.02 TRINITY_DN104_c0_g1_i1:149-2419(+)